MQRRGLAGEDAEDAVVQQTGVQRHARGEALGVDLDVLADADPREQRDRLAVERHGVEVDDHAAGDRAVHRLAQRTGAAVGGVRHDAAHFHRADIDARAEGKQRAALVGGETGGGGIVARIDRRAARQREHRLRAPAVVPERREIRRALDHAVARAEAGAGEIADEVLAERIDEA